MYSRLILSPPPLRLSFSISFSVSQLYFYSAVYFAGLPKSPPPPGGCIDPQARAAPPPPLPPWSVSAGLDFHSQEFGLQQQISDHLTPSFTVWRPQFLSLQLARWHWQCGLLGYPAACCNSLRLFTCLLLIDRISTCLSFMSFFYWNSYLLFAASGRVRFLLCLFCFRKGFVWLPFVAS